MDLRREDILEGRVEDAAAEAERLGLLRRTTPEERQRSKRGILSLLPPGEDVWLFGYGSLMWNPLIRYAERRPGHVFGYHRSYCLRSALGRGTPERPGLTLGLERGGSCRGLLFRIAADIAEAELDFVWNREMIGRAYTPRLVAARTGGGAVRAIAFVIDARHEAYAGKLTPEETADVIARARGPLGRCSEYLENTVLHLDELGIADGPMHRLLARVRDRMTELGIDAESALHCPDTHCWGGPAMAPKETEETADDPGAAAIAALMRRYFDAVYDGDVPALREIFHPENRLAGLRGDEERFSSLERFLARVERRPREDASGYRLLSVDRSGRAGVAKIAYRYHGIDFVDYMAVLELDGRWRIVAKSFDGYRATG